MKKKMPKPYEFPPDIFWISPQEKLMNIIGHVTDIKAKPEKYGFHAAPETKEEVEEYLAKLFEDGWLRGRFYAGKFEFQMERPRSLPMQHAYNLVEKWRDSASRVVIDFWLPQFAPLGKEMDSEDFLAVKIPTTWGLGRVE